MKLTDFEYDLPPELIAQEPVTPRDHSKLMVLSGGTLEHVSFFDLPKYLKPSDTLVLNNTRVFPARLRGQKITGGKIELLLLERQSVTRWLTLVRGAFRAGTLKFKNNIQGELLECNERGEWTIEFSEDIRPHLDDSGEMPLPPYIKRPTPRAADLERYQTVVAKEEGAVAAPTAGFHFTEGLLDTLRAMGVEVVTITLHVGWGTFRPVRTEHVEDHQMLPERYVVPSDVASLLTQRRKQGRIIAVGTTVTRTLESIWNPTDGYVASSGQTNLFITPKYSFQAIDGLITNFHLPDSTPLLLACAFYQYKNLKTEDGKLKTDIKRLQEISSSVLCSPFSSFSLKSAYQEAIKHRYRFYSYGDAMLIA